MKKLFVKLPILPLSALVFYGVTFCLWSVNIIPSPVELVGYLEKLYANFGYISLIIATFFEGVAYLGLYIPGSFVIALTVFFSDGKPITLLGISVIVAVVLTLTSVTNYFLGRYVASRHFWDKEEILKESENLSKGLLVSMLHPNLLAFYFFNAGLEKKDIRKIAIVPFFMVPYGFVFANGLSLFSNVARAKLENSNFLFGLIIVWLFAAFLFEHKRQIKKYALKKI